MKCSVRSVKCGVIAIIIIVKYLNLFANTCLCIDNRVELKGLNHIVTFVNRIVGIDRIVNR